MLIEFPVIVIVPVNSMVCVLVDGVEVKVSPETDPSVSMTVPADVWVWME